MSQFFEKPRRSRLVATLRGGNKIFIAIIAAGAIIGVFVYFGFRAVGGPRSGAGSKVTSPPENKECLAPAEALVTKIIDGDTAIVEGGYNVRILGMDADETGYPCYEAAKSRLEELVLNKKVRLEKDQTDVDQYNRCLRYVFLDDLNIGLRLVEEGLAIARFYEPDVKYKDEITKVEKEAIDNKIGCKWTARVSASPEPEAGFSTLTTEKTKLSAVFACNAGNYYGKEVIVEGKIADGFRSKTNTVFLNFEKPYPNQCFTAVIFSSDQYKFVQNPEEYYPNKIVRVRGEIKEYQGKPEIILKGPSQIEVGK